MKIVWRSKRFLIPTAVLMIGVIGTAAAVTALFTHTFPQVIIPGVPALVTATCTSLVLAVVAPTTASGVVVFGCAPIPPATNPLPAFSLGSQAVALSVTGSIPSGYEDLYAIPTSIPSTKCALTTGSVAILSSNPTPSTTGLTLTASAGTGLPANSGYDYCADYSNTSLQPLTVPTFTVSWQQ